MEAYRSEPTRPLWVSLGVAYTLLVTAFGWGVRASASRNRRLRTAGGLIAFYGLLGVVWPFAPMHQRAVLAAGGGTPSDTTHLVLGGVTVLLMFMAIGFGAAAFGKRFRLYSIATMVILVAFGALTGVDAPRVAANLPTPLAGLRSRGAFSARCSSTRVAAWRSSRRASAADSPPSGRRWHPFRGIIWKTAVRQRASDAGRTLAPIIGPPSLQEISA